MKRILFLLALSATLFSFRAWLKNEFTITGTATGIADGKKVYLQLQQPEKGTVRIDSAKVTGGKFTLKGVATEPSIHFVEVEGIQGKVAFVLEEGAIELTLYKDSIGKSRVGGTKSNVELQKFNSTAMKIQRKAMEFQQANNTVFQEAQSKNDTATVNGLIRKFNGFQQEMITLSTTYPAKNPTSFLSLLLIDNMFNNPTVDIAKIKSDFALLDAKLKNTKQGQALQKRINDYHSVNVGDLAPAFSAVSPDGKQVSLKESLGKVTLVDFWASWCGPCRRENPNVVKLYADYHAKGLNIISISLDRPGQDAAWKGAIEKDGLTWTHVSNLMFWDDPIAKDYHVQSIPATFLLDEKGTIIAVNLRGEELRAKVASLLDK
ncbi:MULTISPECIES: TlpA disulfide reductase family protein [unclassified Flavobacterium]|uniref:TlpA disulfide reductase family protein n=1 Tax=unclassified Flavobacterium TaxID=196869 RepID=UPI001F142CD3|nr:MULTISPECIES: TlpA disulfide reductase family protein [unclassified Flavobacterium]UMY65340.1 AhpC/TSA family protein [Flavobacterium sp. HJ-32-4]